MRKTRLIIILAVILAGTVSGWVLFNNIRNSSTEINPQNRWPTGGRNGQNPQESQPLGSPTVSSSTTSSSQSLIVPATIIYTNSGYSPMAITVKSGQTVTWKNEETTLNWVASAVHPTHKAYPGSDIAKCGTVAQSSIFDACRGYDQGESWEFKFIEKGTWKYHNHLQPNHFGTVIVE